MFSWSSSFLPPILLHFYSWHEVGFDLSLFDGGSFLNSAEPSLGFKQIDRKIWRRWQRMRIVMVMIMIMMIIMMASLALFSSISNVFQCVRQRILDKHEYWFNLCASECVLIKKKPWMLMIRCVFKKHTDSSSTPLPALVLSLSNVFPISAR